MFRKISASSVAGQLHDQISFGDIRSMMQSGPLTSEQMQFLVFYMTLLKGPERERISTYVRGTFQRPEYGQFTLLPFLSTLGPDIRNYPWDHPFPVSLPQAQYLRQLRENGYQAPNVQTIYASGFGHPDLLKLRESFPNYKRVQLYRTDT